MLSWVSVAARTGVVITDLPDLAVSSVARRLCGYTSTTASLPVPTAPSDWLRASLHGGSFLILLDDPQDGTDPTILWGGMVMRRSRGSSDTVSLSLATVEAYLDRRFVGDVTYTATGQNAIVADLIDRYVDDTLPLRVVQVGGTGTPRDRAYADASDKSVLSVLTELAGIDGGPEWTVEWEWGTTAGGARKITPVLYVGARIGTAPMAGLAPAATFEMPGCVTAAEFVEDFSTGKGATDVMATSTANADVRPQSPRQTSGDTDRPTFEYRWSPSTAITDIPTLTAHAQSALAGLRYGSRSLTLTSDYSTGPRLGSDFWLGDDVAYQIGTVVDDTRTRLADDVYVDTYADIYGATGTVLVNPDGRDSVPAFPGGLAGTSRCIGWDLSLSEPITISPVLAGGDLSNEGI